MKLTRVVPALMLSALIGQASAAVASSSNLSLAISVNISNVSLRPAIISAVTGDSDGDGYLDRLTLTFSRPVTIIDAGGSGDGFNAITLSGGYVIAPGDYSAVNATTLVLKLVPGTVPDTGVTIDPTYHVGLGSSIRDTVNGAEVGDGDSFAGTDGAPPVILSLAPGTGTQVANTQLSYVLSEPLATGTANWVRVGGSADPATHIQALVGGELAGGAHTDITLANAPLLVDGAVYNLTLTGRDAAGFAAVPRTNLGIAYRLDGLPAPRPRIVSEAPLWAVGGQPWVYDVVVDARSIQSAHAVTTTYNLAFTLSEAPAGATLVPTGGNTARVTWPVAAGLDRHDRVVVTVVDTLTGTADRQEIQVFVIAVPSAGG